MQKLFLILIAIFLGASQTFAMSSVVINEFQTSTPQKVELYNNGTELIDLSNWYLDDNGGTSYLTIPPGTFIYPGACISFSSNFSFNTSSPDSVRLFDNTAPPTSSNAKLIDGFNYEKITDDTKNFQRVPDGSSIWIAGTPSVDQSNLTGKPCVILPSPAPTNIPSPTVTPTPYPTVLPITVSPVNFVYISEVMAAPPSGTHEWVELYNDNAFPVTLSNWQIDDMTNAGAAPHIFSLTLGAYSYGVIELPTAMFNNGGDVIQLLDPAGSLKDFTRYTAQSSEHTWARVDFTNQQFCLQIPSKGQKNSGCVTPSAITAVTVPTPSSTLDRVDSTGVVIPKVQKNLHTQYIPSADASVSAHFKEVANSDEYKIASQNDTGESVPYESGSADVLGTSQYNPLMKVLGFVSLLTSLLTIVTVVYKMRVWLKSYITGSRQSPAWQSYSSYPPDPELS